MSRNWGCHDQTGCPSGSWGPCGVTVGNHGMCSASSRLKFLGLSLDHVNQSYTGPVLAFLVLLMVGSTGWFYWTWSLTTNHYSPVHHHERYPNATAFALVRWCLEAKVPRTEEGGAIMAPRRHGAMASSNSNDSNSAIIHVINQFL